MLTNQHEPFSVTWSQVDGFRLAHHHLLERASTQDLLSVVYHMPGAQAQLFSAAQISLWSRIRELQTSHIDEAVKERSLVKASCMRRTLFLLPSEHLAMFVRGTARRAEREIRWARGKGVPDRVLDSAINATLEVLDEPLTRPEIADRVSLALGVRSQAVHGGGWGRKSKLAAVPVGELTYPVVELLHLVASRGVVCYGPYQANEPTFVRADAWLPHWQDVPAEQAESMLLRCYLRAFGPATAQDFSLWAGITFAEARTIWEREASGFARVSVEGWQAAILQEDLDELVNASFENLPLRLLPYFDTFIFGHREREHLVSLQHRSKIYRAQGWIYPVVLVDGRAAGVWLHIRQGKRLNVKVTPFGSLSQRHVNGIQEEAIDLGRFLGIADVEVHIA